MTDMETKESIRQAIKENFGKINVPLPDYLNGAALIEIAFQLRRIGDSIEKIEQSRTSIAVSLDRLADAADRAYPRRRQGE